MTAAATSAKSISGFRTAKSSVSARWRSADVDDDVDVEGETSMTAASQWGGCGGECWPPAAADDDDGDRNDDGDAITNRC